MELLRQQVSNLPIDQAADAVAQAMKFQAIRGYQKDLEAGKPASESLAKWAPMMFSTPKSATMSGAASLIRASQPRVMNAGSVLYRVPQTGNAVPLTPAPTKVPAPNRFDLQEHSSYLTQARQIEGELAKDPTGPDAEAQRKEIQRLQGEAAKVRQRNTPTGGESAKRVSTQAEYDALKSGEIYIGKNGHRYRKP